MESCEVADAFADDSYMPSINGLFDFKVTQKPLHFQNLNELKISFSGSYINKRTRNRFRRRKKEKVNKMKSVRSSYRPYRPIVTIDTCNSV